MTLDTALFSKGLTPKPLSIWTLVCSRALQSSAISALSPFVSWTHLHGRSFAQIISNVLGMIQISIWEVNGMDSFSTLSSLFPVGLFWRNGKRKQNWSEIQIQDTGLNAYYRTVWERLTARVYIKPCNCLVTLLLLRIRIRVCCSQKGRSICKW